MTHMTDMAIVLFDGDCALCSRWVQFLIARDRRRIFRFAPLSGTPARRMLQPFAQHNRAVPGPDSVVLIHGDQLFMESDAIIGICSRLPWPWKGFVLLKAIPRAWRDAAYRAVARRRHRFARGATCPPFPADHSDRLLREE